MALKKSSPLKPPRPIHDIAPPAGAQKARRLKPLLKPTRLKIGVAVIVGILALVAIRQYQHTKNELALKDPAKLSAQISKFLELPSDETPTLATVNDVSKLGGQSFFKRAQQGDKVLIYSQASRAVLYRPSTKKIIEYSVVNLGSAGAKPPAQ